MTIDKVRLSCYKGNGTGIPPKRFTCYRGDRVGYTDECMRSYDEYRQMALEKLNEYENTNLSPGEVWGLMEGAAEQQMSEGILLQEIAHLDTELQKYHQAETDCWVWEEPDEANHIETMADKLKVLIPAHKFRRALELLQVEAEGRLHIAPCKDGTTIWVHQYYPGDNYLQDETTIDSESYLHGFSEYQHGEAKKGFWFTREAAEAALSKEGTKSESAPVYVNQFEATVAAFKAAAAKEGGGE